MVYYIVSMDHIVCAQARSLKRAIEVATELAKDAWPEPCRDVWTFNRDHIPLHTSVANEIGDWRATVQVTWCDSTPTVQVERV